MSLLTDTGIEIMKHLSKFLYLTVDQLQILRVSKSCRFLQHKMKQLATIPTPQKPFISVLKYHVVAKIGRVAHVYTISKSGAQKLDELFPDEAPFPFVLRPSTYFRDYFHRHITVTAHIRITQLLKKYPSLQLAHWDRYFEKTGCNHSGRKATPLHAKTRVELEGENRFIIPDVIFLIRQNGSTSKSMLACLEISNGKDTKRLLKQIALHAEALKNKAVGKKHKLNTTAHQVLFLFSEPGLLKAVQQRFFEIPPYPPLCSPLFAGFQ